MVDGRAAEAAQFKQRAEAGLPLITFHACQQFEEAVEAFLGEKRRDDEPLDAFMARMVVLMSNPRSVIQTQRANDIDFHLPNSGTTATPPKEQTP
jgi:hypothetical protein